CRSQGSRKAMRVGSFVLAAQFPGQGEGEALHRAVRSAEVAEEAGLDSVWLAEHHFVPYGTCPSAVTLAALLLGRTRRLRVGTAVSVLPTAHPVALGEQAALLHLTSGGRFSLGVGRGGPWVDLEVFGSGLEAYEQGFPESLDLLMRWLREPRVGADGERFRFREVPVVPRPSESLTPGGGPEVVVACTSPASVRLAAERGLPILLGMHVGDEEKAEMVALWRRHARASGRPAEEIQAAAHVSAGVCQIADRRSDAVETLTKAMPGWLRQGLAAGGGRPVLLGMHVGDEQKAEMAAWGRRHARASGRPAEEIQEAAHVSAGVCQIADRRSDAVETLTKAMPGWLRQGLEAHVTV